MYIQKTVNRVTVYLKCLILSLVVVVVKECHNVQQNKEDVGQRVGGRVTTPLIPVGKGDGKLLQTISLALWRRRRGSHRAQELV